MKGIIFFCCLLIATAFTFCSCNKEKEEDVSVLVVGEYIGTYGKPTGGVIENYSVLISSIDKNTIKIAPLEGNDFGAWESDVRKEGNSVVGISSSDEHRISFIVDPIISITFIRPNIGDIFQGQKK